MSNHINVPESKTDPFDQEPTNVAPVRVRIAHADGTHTLLLESKDVLGMPLFLHGGRLYVRRGANGTEHLYREVPEIPRLDAVATRAEEVAFVGGVVRAKGIVVKALADCAGSRTTSREAAFAAVVMELDAHLAALGMKP